MRFEKEDIGARILGAITSGLYDGNRNCLREYVQNSIDAGAKNVWIEFENGTNDLIIRDDGSGMDEKGIKDALNLGISTKTDKDIGWRGIGFWSGVSSCLKIVVISKKKHGKKLRVEINNRILREGIEGNSPATDLLTEATSNIGTEPMGSEDADGSHFTIIRLESILPQQRGVFEKDKVRGYLQETVPAPFDDSLFTFAPRINKLLASKSVQVPPVNIEFDGKKIFRPPFESEIFFDVITQKDFVVKGKLIATGWFVTTNQNKALKSPNGGVFFKKNGFTIGNQVLVADYLKSGYSQWQYGEIHVIYPELKENSARNGFEFNNDYVLPFLEEAGKWILQFQMSNRYQSAKLNGKLIAKAQESLEDGDASTARKCVRRIDKRLKLTPSAPSDPALQTLKRNIDVLSSEQLRELPSVKRELKTIVAGPEIAKEHLQSVIDRLPPEIRHEIRGQSAESARKLLSSSTDVLIKLLKDRTGLTTNELKELSKRAFDWEAVARQASRKPPLLTIAGQFDLSKKDDDNVRLANRNRHFGVMVYALHDLYINQARHSPGKECYEWFEKSSEDERDFLTADFYSMLDFAWRVIGKSKDFKP